MASEEDGCFGSESCLHLRGALALNHPGFRGGLSAWMPVFAAEETTMRQRIAFWTGHGVRHFPLGADKMLAAAAIRTFSGWPAA